MQINTNSWKERKQEEGSKAAPEVTLLMPSVPKENGIQLPAQPAPYPAWALPPHPRSTKGEQQEQWVAEIRNAFLV